MELTIAQYVIPAIIGAIAGVLGALVAPWANWGIEKRRYRHGARVKLIEAVRSYVGGPTYSYPDFKLSTHYSQLLPYLSRNAKTKIKKETTGGRVNATIIVGGRDGGVNTQHRSLFLDELVRLESKWNLV